MGTYFVMSENDRDLIVKAVSRTLREQYNSKRGDAGLALSQAPEVYVALTPHLGIPAVDIPGSGSGTGTGTGSGEQGGASEGDIPGSAFCVVYHALFNRAGTPVMRQMSGRSLLVYNLSGTAIPGTTWIVVVRDKHGDWYVPPTMPSTPTPIPPKVIQRVTLTTNQNNFTVTGDLVIVTLTAVNVTITGFAKTKDNQEFQLQNSASSAYELSVNVEDSASSATNRVHPADWIGNNQFLYRGQQFTLKHDTGGSNRWIVEAVPWQGMNVWCLDKFSFPTFNDRIATLFFSAARPNTTVGPPAYYTDRLYKYTFSQILTNVWQVAIELEDLDKRFLYTSGISTAIDVGVPDDSLFPSPVPGVLYVQDVEGTGTGTSTPPTLWVKTLSGDWAKVCCPQEPLEVLVNTDGNYDVLGGGSSAAWQDVTDSDIILDKNGTWLVSFDVLGWIRVTNASCQLSVRLWNVDDSVPVTGSDRLAVFLTTLGTNVDAVDNVTASGVMTGVVAGNTVRLQARYDPDAGLGAITDVQLGVAGGVLATSAPGGKGWNGTALWLGG